MAQVRLEYPEATLKEVAQKMGQPYEKLEKMIPFFMGIISLDESLDSRYDDGDDVTRLDLLVDDSVDVFKSAVNPMYRLYLQNMLSHFLTEKELLVLKLFVGFDGVNYSIPEIADIIGVSKQRVSQLHNNALEKIRKRIKVRGEIID